MPLIRCLIRIFRKKRALFIQLLYVTLAFVLMVVSSSVFVRNMLQDHLSKQAMDTLLQTKVEIEAELVEPKTALAIISNTVKNMILRNSSVEEVEKYLIETGAEIQNKKDGFQFNRIFGYFESFGGKFLYSEELDGDTDFDPQRSFWYETADKAEGNIAVTPVYFRNDHYYITYVHRISIENGIPLGIICLEVPLDSIQDHVVNMRITEGGYGILMNQRLDVIAYPNDDILGKNARIISSGFLLIANELESGYDLFEREMESYFGMWTVTFTMRLDNGWILTVATPKAEYYEELYNMRLIISFLGAFFALVLIIILVRLDNAKSKTDEENQRNSILLTEMEKSREADERTRLMLNATPLGCKLWDKDLNVIECNQEALNLFDIKEKEVFLKRFFDLSPEYQPNGRKTREMAAEYVNTAFKEGYCRFEWMHQKFNGELIPAEITLVRVKHRGEYVIAGYIRDLRELKAMLEEIHIVENDLRQARDIAEENNKAKSKFLAIMSHEIRTPMNVILGVTESQLLSDAAESNAKEAFEKIFDSGHLLLRIINDILDMSKIESGKFELYPVNYEVLSLINDAANMKIMQAEHKNIKFILKVDENIPLSLYGDELRIKQILYNLLSNAFKYTPEGEVELFFSADNSAGPDKTTLCISVRDSGHGMTPEQVNKLFEEYTRFNTEANRKVAGTGLGMGITSSLLKMMGGMICVDSTPGEGSTFTIRIPQVVVKPGFIGKEAAENLESFNFSSMEHKRHSKVVRELMPYGKVLVVDDMKSNLDVATLLLSPYQLLIDVANSGYEAIDIIKSGKEYDIVFMDHMMPEMDGIETLKRIRSFGYKQPVIALTASAFTGQREMFLTNGFNGFISKPIDMRQLNDTLNKFIRDKASERTGEILKEESIPIEINGLDISIPELDIEMGLGYYNDNVEIYLAILRSYVNDIFTLLEKMRNITLETLEDYAIYVHTLKGMSAGIGAEKIKNEAQELEIMAKSGDMAGVFAKNDALITKARNLGLGIQAWLSEHDSRSSRPLLPKPDNAILARLQKCCETYDMNGIDDLMDQLESADYSEDASLITWLREKINGSDLSSIASRLLEYKEKL